MAASLNAKQVNAILTEADQKKTKISTITGELGERLKSFFEGSGIHRKAFSTIAALDRKDEEFRNDFFRSFDELRLICERDRWGGHEGDLLDKEQDEEGGDGGQHREAAERNAKLLNAGIKPLDEAATDAVDQAGKRRGRKPALPGGEANGTYKRMQ